MAGSPRREIDPPDNGSDSNVSASPDVSSSRLGEATAIVSTESNAVVDSIRNSDNRVNGTGNFESSLTGAGGLRDQFPGLSLDDPTPSSSDGRTKNLESLTRPSVPGGDKPQVPAADQGDKPTQVMGSDKPQIVSSERSDKPTSVAGSDQPQVPPTAQIDKPTPVTAIDKPQISVSEQSEKPTSFAGSEKPQVPAAAQSDKPGVEPGSDKPQVPPVDQVGKPTSLAGSDKPQVLTAAQGDKPAALPGGPKPQVAPEDQGDKPAAAQGNDKPSLPVAKPTEIASSQKPHGTVENADKPATAAGRDVTYRPGFAHGDKPSELNGSSKPSVPVGESGAKPGQLTGHDKPLVPGGGHAGKPHDLADSKSTVGAAGEKPRMAEIENPSAGEKPSAIGAGTLDKPSASGSAASKPHVPANEVGEHSGASQKKLSDKPAVPVSHEGAKPTEHAGPASEKPAPLGSPPGKPHASNELGDIAAPKTAEKPQSLTHTPDHVKPTAAKLPHDGAENTPTSIHSEVPKPRHLERGGTEKSLSPNGTPKEGEHHRDSRAERGAPARDPNSRTKDDEHALGAPGTGDGDVGRSSNPKTRDGQQGHGPHGRNDDGTQAQNGTHKDFETRGAHNRGDGHASGEHGRSGSKDGESARGPHGRSGDNQPGKLEPATDHHHGQPGKVHKPSPGVGEHDKPIDPKVGAHGNRRDGNVEAKPHGRGDDAPSHPPKAKPDPGTTAKPVPEGPGKEPPERFRDHADGRDGKPERPGGKRGTGTNPEGPGVKPGTGINPEGPGGKPATGANPEGARGGSKVDHPGTRDGGTGTGHPKAGGESAKPHASGQAENRGREAHQPNEHRPEKETARHKNEVDRTERERAPSKDHSQKQEPTREQKADHRPESRPESPPARHQEGGPKQHSDSHQKESAEKSARGKGAEDGATDKPHRQQAGSPERELVKHSEPKTAEQDRRNQHPEPSENKGAKAQGPEHPLPHGTAEKSGEKNTASGSKENSAPSSKEFSKEGTVSVSRESSKTPDSKERSADSKERLSEAKEKTSDLQHPHRHVGSGDSAGTSQNQQLQQLMETFSHIRNGLLKESNTGSPSAKDATVVTAMKELAGALGPTDLRSRIDGKDASAANGTLSGAAAGQTERGQMAGDKGSPSERGMSLSERGAGKPVGERGEKTGGDRTEKEPTAAGSRLPGEISVKGSTGEVGADKKTPLPGGDKNAEPPAIPEKGTGKRPTAEGSENTGVVFIPGVPRKPGEKDGDGKAEPDLSVPGKVTDPNNNPVTAGGNTDPTQPANGTQPGTGLPGNDPNASGVTLQPVNLPGVQIVGAPDPTNSTTLPPSHVVGPGHVMPSSDGGLVVQTPQGQWVSVPDSQLVQTAVGTYIVVSPTGVWVEDARGDYVQIVGGHVANNDATLIQSPQGTYIEESNGRWIPLFTDQSQLPGSWIDQGIPSAPQASNDSPGTVFGIPVNLGGDSLGVTFNGLEPQINIPIFGGEPNINVGSESPLPPLPQDNTATLPPEPPAQTPENPITAIDPFIPALTDPLNPAVSPLVEPDLIAEIPPALSSSNPSVPFSDQPVKPEPDPIGDPGNVDPQPQTQATGPNPSNQVLDPVQQVAELLDPNNGAGTNNPNQAPVQPDPYAADPVAPDPYANPNSNPIADPYAADPYVADPTPAASDPVPPYSDPQPDPSNNGSKPLIGSVELEEPFTSVPESSPVSVPAFDEPANTDPYIASGDNRVEPLSISSEHDVPTPAVTADPGIEQNFWQSADVMEQRLQDEREQKEREREAEKREREDAERARLQAIQKQQEEDERRLQELLLAEKTGKTNQFVVEPQVRQKYKVKQGDTLESIAVKNLRDRHLALLIFKINEKIIPVKQVDDKRVPQLKPGLIIYLPTPSDVRLYRVNLANGKRVDSGIQSGKMTKPQPMENDSDAARRAAVQHMLGSLAQSITPADGRIRYAVRLGDTLRSIAIKHPALQDVSLWRLIAEINDLPTEVDHKGAPTVKLRRGVVLVIPGLTDIAEFKANKTCSRASGLPPAPEEDSIAEQILKAVASVRRKLD